MHCFPPEICEQIYRFACTDDGTTGRSLSLVSKYIHDTSAPYKLQSIAICGAEKAASFLSVLKKSPSHLRRVVYFVIAHDSIHTCYVADEEPSGSSSSIIRTTKMMTNLLPGVKRYRELKMMRERDHRAMQSIQSNWWRDAKMFFTLINILTIINTSLSTLTMDFSYRLQVSRIQMHSPIPLPALTSLTIDSYSIYHHELFEWPLSLAVTLLPSLVYLDLGGLKIYSNTSSLYAQIAQLAPSLTHLRFPMTMTSDPVQGRRLATIMDQDLLQSNNSTTDRTNRLPSTLQRVFIQLSPIGCTSCFVNEDAYIQTTERYRFLAEQDKRIVILDKADSELHIEELVRRYRFTAIEI